MDNRREFFKSVAALSVAGLAGITPEIARAEPPARDSQGLTDGDDRAFWVSVLEKVAAPVLENLSRRELRKNMPVEAAVADRVQCTHLEAFGRLLAGIAPWLEAKKLSDAEAALQKKYISLAQSCLDAATDPGSADFMDARVRAQVVTALKSSRGIATPTSNNWVMFAATVEAALHIMGEPTIGDRFENCVQHMLGWYKGDGVYGDGEYFHFDYYNSFVIHPMLLDVLAVLKPTDKQFEPVYARELQRARRYAAIQERLIAPDGTFPSIGRSTTYRFGAFHALAQIAWMRALPESVKPPQVRSAMTAVIRKMIEAPGTFDEHGWLRIGFYGHQPTLGESYISTGSLYLCLVALLPLGLAPEDEFWSAPPARWTQQRIWSGESLPADHAMKEGA